MFADFSLIFKKYYWHLTEKVALVPAFLKVKNNTSMKGLQHTIYGFHNHQ